MNATAICGADFSKVCGVDEGDLVSTVSSGWRSTGNIYISSLAVYVACSWSILRLNVPDQKKSSFRRLVNPVTWAIIAFWSPEFMALAALFDYIKAATNTRAMKALGVFHWTEPHAFLANMGGIVIFSPERKPFIATGEIIELLVREGAMEAPEIYVEEIHDKNEADGAAKVLAIIQSLWLVVDSIVRVAMRLSIAPIEFAACLHVLISLTTYSLQWHKPRGISVPMVVTAKYKINDVVMRQLDGLNPQEPDADITTCTHVPTLSPRDSECLTQTFGWLLLYVFASSVASRVIQIALADRLNVDIATFRDANIAGLVFLLTWPILLVLATAMDWLDTWWFENLKLVCAFGFYLSSTIAIGAAFGASRRLQADAYYPTPWMDWAPHI